MKRKVGKMERKSKKKHKDWNHLRNIFKKFTLKIFNFCLLSFQLRRSEPSTFLELSIRVFSLHISNNGL